MAMMKHDKLLVLGIGLGLSVSAVMAYSRGSIRYGEPFFRGNENSNQLDPVYSGSPVYNSPSGYGNRPYNYGSIRSAPIGVQPLPGSVNIGGFGYQRTPPGPPGLPYGFQNPTLQPQTYAAPAYSYRPVTVFLQQRAPGKMPDIIVPPKGKDGMELTPEPMVIDAEKDPFFLLRRMSDFVGGLRNFRIGTQDTHDEILLSGEKVQLSSWRSFHVSRPNKLVSDIQGDVANKRFWYDGKTGTLLDRNKKVYGSFVFSGTLDRMMDMAATRYHISGVFIDLLCRDFYYHVAETIQHGEYVGRHKVDQYDCDHLAFTQGNADWEIWIQTGNAPYPRKFTITYKARREKPRYTWVLPYWETNIQFPADFFTFIPPHDTTKIDLLPVLTTEDKLKAAETIRNQSAK